MSNHRISITAEFASLIKAKDNKKYNYFVSNRVRKLYNIISGIISKKAIDNIFQSRLDLSEEFDVFIKSSNFETIVEFGAGYSLRGFEYALKNKNKRYLDTDFTEVVENKRKIINKICQDYKISWPENYLLLSLDVLNDNIEAKIGPYLKESNLFLAEGLTPYFSHSDYLKFIRKIKPLLRGATNIFFSQENFLKERSFLYKIIRKFIAIITNNPSYLKFKTKEDLLKCLEKEGFMKPEAYYKNGNLFYKI